MGLRCSVQSDGVAVFCFSQRGMRCTVLFRGVEVFCFIQRGRGALFYLEGAEAYHFSATEICCFIPFGLNKKLGKIALDSNTCLY